MTSSDKRLYLFNAAIIQFQESKVNDN